MRNIESDLVVLWELFKAYLCGAVSNTELAINLQIPFGNNVCLYVAVAAEAAKVPFTAVKDSFLRCLIYYEYVLLFYDCQ